MNEIYLRRRKKLYVSTGEGGATLSQVCVVQMRAEQLGFVFSQSLVAQLGSLSVVDLSRFMKATLKALQKITGAHQVHKPLYPGFPWQVIALSDAQLYLNAVAHYTTLCKMPNDGTERTPLLNGRQPVEIELGTLEEFELIFKQLAGSKTSLSAQDQEDLTWFAKGYTGRLAHMLPSQIGFKENLGFVGALLYQYAPIEVSHHFLQTHVKTATDVLRFAVSLSDGDVSLAAACKFKSMKRSLRKLLLGLVEGTLDPTEDMLRWPERWKRLAEVLHPGDFAARFPKTWVAIQVVRNHTPFQTFNAKIEIQLTQGKPLFVAEQLASRPGELARRLDHIIRLDFDSASLVLDVFERCASHVATPVLLQVLNHFEHRGQASLRAFFPKGQIGKVFALFETRQALSPEILNKAVHICEKTLIERFAKLPALGDCYVDPVLENFVTPLAQRSASRSLRTLVRGSQLPLEDTQFIRLFLWWTNGQERTDIDLSAVFYGDDFNYIDTVSYYNLKGYGAHHSGDIVDAPQGAAEFIDLDLKNLRERKIRFVVMSLNSYSRQAYCELPECFAGWMTRDALNSGEVFEPRTVVDRLDLSADTQICLPLVLDLNTHRMVWMDVALRANPRWNNVNNNLTGVSLMLRALTQCAKPDLYTLMRLHAKARGVCVETPEQAQTIFSIDKGITPFHTDEIRAQFL
jgi:hypothetical protein